MPVKRDIDDVKASNTAVNAVDVAFRGFQQTSKFIVRIDDHFRMVRHFIQRFCGLPKHVGFRRRVSGVPVCSTGCRSLLDS